MSKPSVSRFSFLRAAALVPLVLLAAACAEGPQPGSRPLPALTFSDLAPLALPDAARVDVVDAYNPSADPADVSARFPGPPDKVLATYARQRLRPGGGPGTLKFVIEDAHVHQEKEEQDIEIARKLGLGESDRFTVGIRLTLYIAYPDHEGPRSTLTFARSTSIPRGDTLAEKEFKQLSFLEALMKDVDKSVAAAVQGPLQQAQPVGVYAPYSPAQPPPGQAAAPAYAPPAYAAPAAAPPAYAPPAYAAPAYNGAPAYAAPPAAAPAYDGAPLRTPGAPRQAEPQDDAAPAPLPDPSTSPF
jgi:hypothetical protein